jgi:hypothetical protein
VDIPACAETHLYKTLLKVKSMKSSPLLPSTVEAPPRTNIDTATANVTARMYNAKHVKEALAQTLDAIREIIDPDAGESALKKAKGGNGSDNILQKANKDGKNGKEVDEAQLKQRKGTSKTALARERSPSFSSVSDEEGFDKLVEAMEELGSTSGAESAGSEVDPVGMDGDSDFDSETYAGLDARIASSSEDEVDKESPMFADGTKRQLHSHPGIRLPRNSTFSVLTDDETTEENEVSLLEVGDDSSAPEERVFSFESEIFKPGFVPTTVLSTQSRPSPSKPEPPTRGKSKRDRLEDTGDSEAPKPLRTMATKASTSTFVPSLNMVGYWSGSESEASDVEEHVAPRKNRRGQRARQQIWEKKYKDTAKHLSAEAKAKQKGRDAGWDPKRGATGKEDSWRKGKGSTWKGKDFSGENGGANAVPVAVVKRGTGIAIKKNGGKDDDGPLHPSWEAKKVAKSKIAIVPFQGKKITFD